MWPVLRPLAAARPLLAAGLRTVPRGRSLAQPSLLRRGLGSSTGDKAVDPAYVNPEFPCPDTDTACQSPRKFREVSNDVVFQLAIHGKPGATRERLVREVMRVDAVSWAAAREKVREMNRENDRYAAVAQLPYSIGLFGATLSGVASLPLVFHRDTVLWFASEVVQMRPEDIPPLEELNTCWAVGSFSWSYMEPLLGTLSFVLLAAQLMRNNMQHLGYQPYTDYVLQKRADRLCRLYPAYDRNITREFAMTDYWHK